MEIEILYALNKGILKDEKLVLRATENLDIGKYLVLDNTYSADGQPTNLLRHCFWFPDKEIKAGDKIILYTKEGTDTEKLTKTGSTSHFFYWGLSETVWNEEIDGAIVIKAKTWINKTV